MAPEQAEGTRSTPAADLYALALVLYEALAGHEPVARGDAGRDGPPGRDPAARAARRRRDLPLELCDAIDRASDPDPAPPGHRWPSCAERSDRARRSSRDEPGLVAPRRPRAGIGPAASLPVPPLATAGAAGLAALGAFLAPGTPDVAPGWSSASPPRSCSRSRARAGWPACCAAAGWTAGQDATGAALLIVMAAAPVPVLLARSPGLWSYPALAPLLGSADLAAAFPALAALGRTVPRRAALGALGAWWWLLAGPLLADRSAGALAGHAARRDRRHG